ncbi:MAG: bacterioferritin-associated ferredoxin [Pseudomonadota bacterium]
MYVCICHAITDSDIRNAAANGVRSVNELSARLGVATGCGSCADMAQTLLDSANTPSGSSGFGAVHRYVPAPA